MARQTEKASYKVLLNSGAVSKEQLETLQKQSENLQVPISQLIVEKGVMKESELLGLYAKSSGSSCVNLKNISAEGHALEKVPAKFAWYYKFFPVQLQGKKMTIAVSHLFDVYTLDEIRFGLGCELEVVFAPRQDIEDGLRRYYGVGAETVEKILAQSPSRGQPAPEVKTEEEDIEKLAEKASIVDLVNQIILEAYKERASDIHIEPFKGKVRLRYRIDGVLIEQRVPAEMNQFLMPILSRIKIMANLNIVERRLPQDGKAHVRTQEQSLDLRVSSIPTPYGESIVIRILPSKMILGFDQLGLETKNLKTLQELIARPHGIIFVTGPTGSGKSTTLYAVLNSLNDAERKIITIEDPIEYEIQGVTQIQVMPEIGLTFARGLRSVLRHDPDVMMVGEVRDLETADIAIRVALTGHLIFSTLHTNDAASGINRLLDIGVEPYLVASSVIAFIAQRLVKVICPACKQEDAEALSEVKEMIRRDLSLPPHEPVKIFKGRGCDACNGTGFWGRTAIQEILVVDEEIRKMIFSRATSEDVKARARAMKMETLRQDGWRKVLKGVTTPDEIIEVTLADEVKTAENLSPQVFVPEPSGTEIPEKRTVAPKEVSSEDEETVDFSEKRKYQRIGLYLNIPYRTVSVEEASTGPDGVSKFKGRTIVGKIENISAGGMCLMTYQSPKPGDLLELTIDLPDGQDPIQSIGRVLHIHRYLDSLGPEGKFSYRVGLSFLAINSTDRMRIENFCKEHSKDEEAI